MSIRDNSNFLPWGAGLGRGGQWYFSLERKSGAGEREGGRVLENTRGLSVPIKGVIRCGSVAYRELRM